jgi:voltage-gated potassium channel
MRSRDIIINYLRYPELIRLLIIVLTVAFGFGTVMYFIEPETFKSFLNAIYWAIITTSTIGYGDFAPHTAIGKIVTMLLVFIGTGFVIYFFSQLASSAVTRQNAYQKGELAYTSGHHHLIVVGWNERSRETITNMLKAQPQLGIVIVDHTLKQNPFNDENIHFVRGNPFEDQTLEKASIQYAQSILITADQNANELQGDMNSIMTLLAAKGLKPSIHAMVEILTPEQFENAKRAGADVLIESTTLTSLFMVNSTRTFGNGEAFKTLLKQQLTIVSLPEAYSGKTFLSCSSELLAQGKLVLGIKRGEEFVINPVPKTEVYKSDQLVVITSQDSKTFSNS